MARGKHAQSKARRDATALQADLETARQELAAEQAACDEARAAVAQLDTERAELARQVADQHETTRPERDRLAAEVDVLVELLEAVEPQRERIQELFDRTTRACVAAFGGGQDGFDRYLQVVMGVAPSIYSAPHERKLSRLMRERLERARGHRHVIRARATEGPAGGKGRAIQGALPRWLDDALDDLVAQQPADGTEQARQLAELDRLADQIAASRAQSVRADCVRGWHPLPWLLPTEAPSTCGTTLKGVAGLGVTTCPEKAAAGNRAPASVEPSPAAPADLRHTAGFTDPRTLLDGPWQPRLTRDAALVEAAGRIRAPWTPAPPHSRPGDAVALRHWHAMAAIGMWLRTAELAEDDLKPDEPEATPPANAAPPEPQGLVGERPEDVDGTADAGPVLGAGDPDAFRQLAGQVAFGLSAAAPFWLPPGQTGSYIEGDPPVGVDLDDLRLPYPQVLLVPAEPLRLEPIVADDPDVRLALLDEAALRLSSPDEAPDLFDLVGLPFDSELWNDLPELGQLISACGALVEAVLLLGDSQGRPSDLFAWCLAVPGRSGGLLGRIVLPARRSRTAYRAQITNLLAVAAWGDWHPPDTELVVPDRPADLTRLIGTDAFRRMEARGGAGAVRVLNVRRTAGRSASDGNGRAVAPHARRGHWRRQHYGPAGSLVRRVRIAPVLVNAGQAHLAPRVYRLPTDSAAAG